MVRKLQPEPTATAKKVRILLVDDHPVVRQGLAMLIDQEVDLTVCGEAEDADQAIQQMRKLNPEVAIIDVSLKESNGLELVKQIKSEFEDLPMLVLSMHDEEMYAPRALRAGAKGYIMKQEAPQKVITAIRRLLKGGNLPQRQNDFADGPERGIRPCHDHAYAYGSTDRS